MTRAFRLLCVCCVCASVRPARAQCPDGTPPPCRVARVASAAPAPNSVAVLYFENLGRDTADAYLADGLTEEVTARLGQVGRLAVTSRTAVRRLRSTAATMEPVALGRALGAAYLVNGSVRRAGSRLRVTVELVRATTGVRAWGDQYDRSDTDLLALQEDIARAVAAGITGRLLPGERSTLAARPTRDPAAYDHYLRGNYILDLNDAATIPRALAEYAAALRLDPGFAAARARIALAYALAYNWNWTMPEIVPESVLALGLAAADRALREDSLAADAWLARGTLLFFARQESGEAVLAPLRRAITLDPENPGSRYWLAVVLRRLGDFAGSEAEYHRVLELDPRTANALSELGFLAYSRRRFLESRAWYDSAIALDSTSWVLFGGRARSRLELGDAAGALADGAMVARLAPAGSRQLAAADRAFVVARAGDTATARSLIEPALREVDSVPSLSVRLGYNLVAALTALGERDRALALLERVRPRGPWLWSYLISSGFDPIRSEPRFQRVFEESRPPGAPRLP